jgi:hypothetical protein
VGGDSGEGCGRGEALKAEGLRALSHRAWSWSGSGTAESLTGLRPADGDDERKTTVPTAPFHT